MKKEGVSCMKIYNEGEEPEGTPPKKKRCEIFYVAPDLNPDLRGVLHLLH